MSNQKQHNTVTVSDTLSQAHIRMTDISDSAALDAQVLLAHVLEVPRSWLLAHGEGSLTIEQAEEFDYLLARVDDGEPLPYVLGEWEFYGLPFIVNPAVLIPRPETELLVQTAIDWLRVHPNRRQVADVGCGSGCIGIVIAKYFTDTTITAIDISYEALAIAAQNAARHDVQTCIEFLQNDLLNGVNKKFDLLCANLPYIPTSTLHDLDIYQREPTLALNGGPDGLELIRRLLKQAPLHIAPGGLLLLEIESDQGDRAACLAAEAFPQANINVRSDLARKPRLLVIEVPG